MEITVKFENFRNRAAAYDGEQEIGKCTFTRSDCRWVIEHTEVDPLYGGRGLAGQLVDCVAVNAREQGMKILPLCSYAAKLFKTKEKYQDLL